MKNLLLFLLLASALIGTTLADDVTWTGAGGNNEWNTPANWSTGTVPTHNDDVTIPSGTPTCELPGWDRVARVNNFTNHGTVETGFAGSKVVAMGDIENYGTMQGEDATLELATTSGWVVNWGSISAHYVGLTGDGVGNAEGGSIVSGAAGMRIVALGGEMANEGTIQSSDGGDIYIACDQFNNWGNIKAGNGSEAGWEDGGDVNITANADPDGRGGIVNNYEGAFIGAGTNANSSAEPGKVKIKARKVNNHGQIDNPPDVNCDIMVVASVLRSDRGDALILADSIDVGGSGARIEAASLYLRGNAITIYGPTDYYMIRTVGDMNFNTTADGTVDFSGLHDSRALRSVGSINIFSNNIVEPAEGLNEICDPDPIIFTADASIVDGSIICPAVFDSGGMPGTFSLSMQNLSTAPKVLDYSVSSTRGWVTDAMGTTASVAPFQFDFAEVSYTIPGGTEVGIGDTITAILTIDAVFADTTYGRILCIAEGLGIDEFSSRPSELSLTVSPNPFNSSCQLSQGTIQTPIDGIEIFDLKGNLIWRHTMKELQPQSPITWSPPMSIGSGVYLIKATSGSKEEASTRVIYMK